MASFCCDDEDLEDFLKSDATRLEAGAVTRVFVIAQGTRVVGYVALSADAIELLSKEKKKLGLRHDDLKYWPALKIGRLAVDTQARKMGFGTVLMRTAFDHAAKALNLMGCRLLTVDAYPSAVSYYRELGFEENQAKKPDLNKEPNPNATVSMRYDLQKREHFPWVKDSVEEIFAKKQAKREKERVEQEAK